MKALKIVGIVVGAIVVLVVAGIAIVSSTFDAQRIKSELARVVLEKKQRTLKIDGEVKLAFWPNVAINLGKVSLSEHNSDKEFAAIDLARVSVAVMPLLSKQVVVNNVEVNGARATLVKHKDGTLNIDDLLSKDKSDSAPVQLDIAGVKIANVQLTYRDELHNSTTALTGIDLTSGRVRADTGKQLFSAEAVALAVKGRRDADSFDVRLDLSGIDSAPQAFKVGKLALMLEAKAGGASIKAALETALGADPGKRSLALDKISGHVDIAHPQMPMKQVKLPIAGAFHADLAKQSAEGHFGTQFDESKIALKLSVPKFSPLAIGFDLDIDKLDLDKYLPPEKKGAEAEKKPADGKLDFSALKALNLNGTVRIGSLQAANVKASNLRLQIKAAGGRLDVAPISANLYEGTLNGALSVDANSNAVAVKQNLAGISINPLLKDAAGKDMIEGRGNVAIDVTAHGDTVAALKKALAGSASVVLKDGAIKGINLAQSFRDLKSKFGAKEDSVQQTKAGEKTDFSEMTASFRIAGGVAHNEDLSVKSPFLRLTGNGDIDIGASQLNYLAKASVVASTGGQGGKDLDHLKGLTVPVRLTGPFDAPSWKIELAGLATEAVKAKVEEKKQEIQQKAQDKLGGKLKGLFGK